MAQTTFANQRGIAHKGSQGVSMGFPDVCLTPPQNNGFSPIPIPYANAIDGQAANGDEKAKKVQKKLIETARKAGHTHVDSATSAGVTSQTMKDVTFMVGPVDVKFEGKNVCRLGDPLFHNKKNIVG